MSRRIGLIFQGFLHLAATNPIFRSFRCTRVIRDTACGETENGIGLPQLVISNIHNASQHPAGLQGKRRGPSTGWLRARTPPPARRPTRCKAGPDPGCLSGKPAERSPGRRRPAEMRRHPQRSKTFESRWLWFHGILRKKAGVAAGVPAPDRNHRPHRPDYREEENQGTAAPPRASPEGLPVSMPSAIAGANRSRRNPG